MFGLNDDEPILEDPGGTLQCTNGTRFLHTNAQNSTIAAADCSGVRKSINSYDEYGIPAATNTGRFQYTGQAWLPDLGMYYYKARMYSPTLGRFMQTDPIGYGDGMRWYNYVQVDPVNGRDSSGTNNEIIIYGTLPKANTCGNVGPNDIVVCGTNSFKCPLSAPYVDGHGQCSSDANSLRPENQYAFNSQFVLPLSVPQNTNAACPATNSQLAKGRRFADSAEKIAGNAANIAALAGGSLSHVLPF